MRVRLNVSRLQELLANSRLSQNHWAVRVGISRGHWSDIVNGRHPYPSPKTRLRMIEVLGVASDELFTIETGPTSHDTDFRAALQDRYLIDRELGQGALGSVYLALDVARGRSVAVKVIAPEAACGIGPDALLREISTLSRLQHPNILPLYDSGVVAEHPFFVMPWVRAGSLRDRLRRDTRLSLSDAVTYTRGIAAALQHAHENFVLHCDVKPENVLLHDEHAWLMDFGISRILHAEVSEWRARKGIDVSAGTPAYVAPEQALGEEDLDGRADVYSLGCVVYEMLTGRPPFEGTTTEAVVARRFLAPPPPLVEYAPETPDAVVEVVNRAMAVDRDRRPESAATFAKQLSTAVNSRRTVPAWISLTTTRAVGAVRRRSGRAAANRFGGNVLHLAQDAKFTIRTLRRDWRFALAFILPLALGLGAGASFYAIIDHVIYRPPPQVSNPGELLRFAIASERWPDPFAAGATGVSWIDYDALARQASTLDGVAAFIVFRPSLGRGEGAHTVPAMLATASYFPVLGVRPHRGRFFSPDEDRETSTLVPCVVSERFWRVDLAAATTLGQTLDVGEVRCTVVGVTPPGFNGTGISPIDIYLPVRASAEASHGDEALWNTDGSSWLRVLGRVRPGVNTAQLNLDITHAYQSFTTRRRDPQMKNSMVAGPALGAGAAGNSTRIRTARWLVGGGSALLLLVAANLVNLLIARNLSRVRETAIRLALGGSRRRLFAHSLLECLVLAIGAGAGALLVVSWVGPVARSVLYPGTVWADGPINVRIVALAMGLSLIVGTIIASITAWQSTRFDPATLLSGAGGTRSTTSRASHRARFTLVGVQAALSMALLVASAGFVRSFGNAANTSLGFDMNGLIFAEVPTFDRIDSTQFGQLAFYEDVRQRLATVPGLTSVSLGYNTPWYYNRNEALRIPGRDSLPSVANFGDPAFDAVTPDYLETMRLRLRAGRWITAADRAGSAPVMVVSSSMARLYWADEASALGGCVIVGGSPACRQVVGIVEDIRFTGGLESAYTPSYYLPISQSLEYGVPPKLFIRSRGDAASLIPAVRRLIQGARPNLPAAEVHLMQNHLDPLLSSWRLGAVSFTALGALAGVIAMLGLFSVIAYLVAERRKEFAIRSALGARKAQIVAPVLRQSAAVVGAGAAVGLVMAWRAAPWLQPQLFQVQLLDPLVVGGVVAGLLGVAVIAAAGPARQAATLDPIEALRTD